MHAPRLSAGLLAVLPAVLLLGCGGPGDAPEAAAEPVVLGPEDVVVAGTATIASGPRISGSLEAARKAVMRAEAAGSVEEVAAEIGQPVKRGDLLARIEGSAARDAMASASAQVEAATQDVTVAERELARATRLVEAGAMAARDREGAESAVVAARARRKGAEAQLAAARDQVEATTVRSPMDGVVAERAVNQGDVVAPGAPLFTIIEPSSLRLEGSVPADALGLLQVGTVVRFAVQGHAGKTFEGKVERIAPAVDAATRQIPILVTLPNPEGALVAGLFAEGRVAAEAREGLVVPTDAVATVAGAPTVVRVKDGKAERVNVELGIRNEDTERVEIRGGIEPGDVVLLGAARDVAPGTPVTVRGAEG